MIDCLKKSVPLSPPSFYCIPIVENRKALSYDVYEIDLFDCFWKTDFVLKKNARLHTQYMHGHGATFFFYYFLIFLDDGRNRSC